MPLVDYKRPAVRRFVYKPALASALEHAPTPTLGPFQSSELVSANVPLQ